MSIFCSVKKREADAVYLWGDVCGPEMHGQFRQRVARGETFLEIPFEEWQTLAGITIADDGTVTKRSYVERVIDPNAERPSWLKPTV